MGSFRGECLTLSGDDNEDDGVDDHVIVPGGGGDEGVVFDAT